MLRHIVSHLGTIDDAQFGRVKDMCVSLGEVMVRPMAEALSTEERVRTRERMTAIVVGFGAVGRRTAERLKNSPNVAVRRTAIRLLREFGGNEALPELTELLDDSEPSIQREAVRAIINIGTNRAFQILGQALQRGTPQSRDAIMKAASLVRDERATPLFAYMLRHIDHKKLTSTYLHAVESLGTLKDPEAVPPLKEALYKGEWWAPRRTASLRSAAALALSRIGTPEAHTALEEAAAIGPRGTRAAARMQLAQQLAETPEAPPT
jgi:HEAT repeat protein